jgi:hypothetical protein
VTLVAAGDGDDEAQVGVDQALLRGEVTALDALGEELLLLGLEELEGRGAAQELIEGVRRDRGVVLLGVLLERREPFFRDIRVARSEL